MARGHTVMLCNYHILLLLLSSLSSARHFNFLYSNTNSRPFMDTRSSALDIAVLTVKASDKLTANFSYRYVPIFTMITLPREIPLHNGAGRFEQLNGLTQRVRAAIIRRVPHV